MKRKPVSLKYLFYLSGIFTLLIIQGCALHVPLDSTKYVSDISKSNYIKYQGKEILLNSVINNAADTSIFFYFSQNGKIQYGGPALTSYFWYCFNSALLNIGLGVHEHSAPKGVPVFEFIISSLNDSQVKFTFTLKKTVFLKFKKEYIVTMPQSDTKNPEDLEKRAYQMVDLIITTVLDDKEFETVFLENAG